MANPTKVKYTLPTQDTNGNALPVADLQSIEIGVRPANGQVGVYPLKITDTTYLPVGAGQSEEPLSSFGLLAPGNYFAAARALHDNGNFSAWSAEDDFTIEAPTPNPPTALSVE